MVRDLLKCQFNARTDKKASLDKRIFNIIAFSGLERKGLQFQNIERRLQLQTEKNSTFNIPEKSLPVKAIQSRGIFVRNWKRTELS